MENLTTEQIVIIAAIGTAIIKGIIIIAIPILIIRGIIKMVIKIKHKNKIEQIKLENRLNKKEENNMKKAG